MKKTSTVKSLKLEISLHKRLSHYVYAYCDDKGEIFYVGKGTKNRYLSHLREAEREKFPKTKQARYIRQLIRERRTFKIYLIAHNLDEKKARVVESSVISVLKSLPRKTLLNAIRGSDGGRNMLSIDSIKTMYEEKFADNNIEFGSKNLEKKNCAIVRLNRTYKEGMSLQELYDRTRKAWTMARENLNDIQYVMPTYNRVILEVFKVAAWLPANSTFSKSDFENIERGGRFKKFDANRYEFVGKLAEDKVREKFKNHRIAHSDGGAFVYCFVKGLNRNKNQKN